MDHYQKNISKAILLSLAAFSFFSVSDAARKYLSIDYDIYDILFWQAGVGLIVLFAASPYLGGMRSLLRSGQTRWHIARGLLMAGNTTLSLLAISKVPMMDAYTIYFTTPFVVSLLSVALFKEKIGIQRSLAIVTGFLGALIAFRPGFAELNPAYLYACAAVFTFSFSNLIARRIGTGGGILPYGVYPLFFLMLLCLAVKGGQPLLLATQEFYIVAIFSSACYVVSLITISFSYTLAPTALIAPIQYTQLPWALALGFLIFGNIPDFFKLLGALIIIGSGTFFFMRERRQSKNHSSF